MDNVNYNSTTVPENYVCTKCGAHGVKLWRQYNTFLNHIELKCGKCACKDQDKLYQIDAHGYRVGSYGHRSDQIGWLIPAVLTEDGDTYWGYTSVPEAGVAWWRNLPLEVL